MSQKAVVVAGTIGGVGLLGMAAYFVFAEWQKSEIIKEYMSEVEELESYYNNQVIAGQLTEAGYKGIEIRERALAAKETELERKGWIAEILDSLAKFGIVASAGYISAKVVQEIIKRNPPPPPYKCNVCGLHFNTLAALNRHVKKAHAVRMEQVPLAEKAFRALSPTLQRMLATVSGLGRQIYNTWANLPVGVYIAIAAAALIIIVLTWGTTSPALAPIAAMAF